MGSTVLFRTEATEAERSEALGTIRLATPLSIRVISLVAVAVGVCMILFASFAHYTRRERVTGLLLPTGGLMQMGAPTASVVTKIFVTQGMEVQGGSALISLSGERSSSTLGETDEAITRQLTSERSRFLLDIANLDDMQVEQTAALKQRIDLTEKQVQQLDASIGTQHEQVAMGTALVDKLKPLLQSGYVSVMQYQQQESSVLQLQEAVKTSEGQKLALQAQAADLQEQLAHLPLATASQKNDLERKISDIDQQLAENEAQREGIIKAKERARVSTLLVSPGQTVAAGQALLTLVPDQSPLEATVLVPSSAIGLIKKGQTVHLKYQSFPYQKYGVQTGKISSISLSALSPDQANLLTGKAFTEPMYRVDVSLDKQVIQTGSASASLRPGMSLDADIMLDQRSMIDWLFEPLFASDRHADNSANKTD